MLSNLHLLPTSAPTKLEDDTRVCAAPKAGHWVCCVSSAFAQHKGMRDTHDSSSSSDRHRGNALPNLGNGNEFV